MEDSLLEDNVEIVDLMPKLGINVSDLLSVDEWIGVDSAVRVAQGTMPSDEDNYPSSTTKKWQVMRLFL